VPPRLPVERDKLRDEYRARKVNRRRGPCRRWRWRKDAGPRAPVFAGPRRQACCRRLKVELADVHEIAQHGHFPGSGVVGRLMGVAPTQDSSWPAPCFSIQDKAHRPARDAHVGSRSLSRGMQDIDTRQRHQSTLAETRSMNSDRRGPIFLMANAPVHPG